MCELVLDSFTGQPFFIIVILWDCRSEDEENASCDLRVLRSYALAPSKHSLFQLKIIGITIFRQQLLEIVDSQRAHNILRDRKL